MTSYNLVVATCNVRGIQSSGNRLKKLSILMQQKFDILCLQETRLTSYTDIENVKKTWGESLSLFSIGEDRADGIAILFYTYILCRHCYVWQ